MTVSMKLFLFKHVYFLNMFFIITTKGRDYDFLSFQQLGDEIKVLKEEKEKMIRSIKSVKGKLEKSTNLEEVCILTRLKL